MKSLRILVIEDDDMVAAVLTELLETQGHTICAIAATEGEAVADALELFPEMMIVEVHLREGSGLEAVDRIQRRRSVAHVFVCGDAPRIRALRPGATVIQKPYFEHDLTRALKSALLAAPA
jgi:CheY-like chemotaxis protein